MPSKQKNGLYRTKIKVGVDSNGKAVIKWISGHTKAELERERKKALEYYVTGVEPDADRLFGEYATEWYRLRKEQNLSPSARSSYKTALNRYLLPAFGERNLRAISYRELQEYINTFAGMSDTMITQLLTVLRGVFRQALADRIILNDPAIPLIMPPVAKPAGRRALTSDETAALLPLMDNTRDGMYLATLYYLGLRPGEARGLRWGDFNWEEDYVYIQRDIDYADGGKVGELKTPAAERGVPVPQPLRDLLYPNRGLPEVFLFQGDKSGSALSKCVAASLWLDLMIRAGLVEEIDHPELEELERQYKTKKLAPSAKRHLYNKIRYIKNDLRARYRPIITPYYLRHNYITMCWQAGIDPVTVTRMVGHTDYRTTANIYTHLDKRNVLSSRLALCKVFQSSENKVAQKLHKQGV